MREGALFGTTFGLGAGAVLVGVAVSRLVVGQPADKPGENPPPAVVEAAPADVTEAPPAVVSSVPQRSADAATPRPRRVLPRKHLRAPGHEPAPVASTPADEPAPVASTPAQETAILPESHGATLAIVRGGAAPATPGGRAPGPHIIHVDPQNGGR